MTSILPADPPASNTISVQRNTTRYFIYLAVFILFFCYTVLPIIGSDLSRFPGNLDDARLNLYVLEHSYKYISGQESAFWTAGFFYPHQNVVAYSDNHLGSSVFYVPFRMMGFDRETAFQFWIISGFVLNFAAMAFVLDRSGFGRLAVSLGAAVFTFSPVQILHLGHIQVLHRMPIPLAWYFLDRFLDEYHTSSLALALAFLSWQFYMSIYLGYFLFLLMSFYTIGVMIERNKSVIAHYLDATSSRFRLCHAGLVLAFGFSLFPLYVHYSAPGISRNTVGEVRHLLPRPVSYLLGSRHELIERLLGGEIDVHSTQPWEHTLFVGLIPWVALLAGTVLAIRGGDSSATKLRRVSFMFWGVFFLTLSVHSLSPYRLLVQCLPILTGIRVMSRVTHVLLLPFAYMTAAGIERLFRKPLTWLPGKLAGLAAVVVCLAFAWETKVGSITVNKAEAQRRIATLEKSLGLVERRPKVSEGGPVLAALWLDTSEPAIVRQLDAMLAAQDLNIVTVNGYSRFSAPGFRYPTDCQTLAEVLRDYARILPMFSGRDVAGRVRIAPGAVSCGGHFDARVSRSAGPLPDDAYAAAIAPQCLVCPTIPGSLLKVLVNVTNLSQHPWPQEGIALSARFVRTNDGAALSGFDNRVYIGTDFSPHQSKQYILEMKAPAWAGQYNLEIDMVQDMVTWFSDKHTKRGELPVSVSGPDAPCPASCAPPSPATPRAAAGAVYDCDPGTLCLPVFQKSARHLGGRLRGGWGGGRSHPRIASCRAEETCRSTARS